MQHGRYVRPRGQGAFGDGTNPVPVSIDASSIAHIPNVQIVHVGNLVGVVAPLEFDAIQAAAQLKVQWSDPPPISGSGNLWGSMRAFDSAGKAPARIASQPAAGYNSAALTSAAKSYTNTFKYHYQMHAPIGPNVALADVTPTGAIIYSHVKDGYGTSRPKIATVLGLPVNRVRIVYYEGASTFGGGAQHVDVGQSAAILSKAVGKPVRLQIMRWDEHGWDNYGPATMWDVAGGVDATGNVVAFDATSFGMASYNVTPTESMTSSVTGVALPLGAGSGPGDTTYSGNAVQLRHREPPDHRQDGSGAEQLLQGVDAAGAERAADVLRHRAGRRPSRVPGEHGSVPVPAPEHQHDREDQRRSGRHPVEAGAGRGREGGELAAAGRELHEADG